MDGEIKENGTHLSLKHKAAIRLFGNEKAEKIDELYQEYKILKRRMLTSKGRENSRYLSQFKDKYRGRRCVIIGNGPSLNNTNLGLLKDEITFGLNRIYLMFDKLGFETTFHAVINSLVVDQWAADFADLKAPLFTWESWASQIGRERMIGYLYEKSYPSFCHDINKGVWAGGTVTYVAMQLAYYMGFHKVILVGVDHRFAISGQPNQLVVSEGPDSSHFDPNYFGKGVKWQLPDYETMETAYRQAKKAFESSGRKIVDATVGGALTVFPKMTLESALSECD